MSSLLKTDHNCWRIKQADRLSFLIDGADYFAALRKAMTKARHTIYILSWDINSQLRLVRDRSDDGYPEKLGEFLNALVEKNQNLNIYILNWDFAMIYATGREMLPIFQLDWKTHSRVHFCLDNYLPSGASLHQKTVVIDDNLAFVGGLDLTMGRWDTSDHSPNNPKRDRIGDEISRPYHDAEIMLEGEAAATLAELFRNRWQLVTEKALQPLDRDTPSAWPKEIAADIQHVDIGLARTCCAYKHLPQVSEIHNFYLDAIKSAKSYIYIENQYFTVPSIAKVIQQSLEQEKGPEIVIVQPRETDGWLSQLTMDVLRVRLIKQLQQCDRFNRLKVYYPEGTGLDELPINVHAKIMIVDNRLITVGSANLNNRSMGLDIECNILIDAQSNDTLQQHIAAFHHRLLAEHLACSPDQIRETLHKTKSLLTSINTLTNTNGRYLALLPLELPEDIDRMVPDNDVADPEDPLEPELFLGRILPEVPEKSIRSRIINWLIMISIVTTTAALWHWTPLSNWLDMQTVALALEEINGNAAIPAWILTGFVLAGFIRFPISILVIPAVFVSGLLHGFIYSLLGVLLSAIFVYAVGMKLNRDTIRKLAGSKLNSINKKLIKHGIISIVALRIVPVAPFTVINLVAGASHFHFRDYIVGTLIGMIPALLMLSLITDFAHTAMANPAMDNLVWLALTVALAVIAAYFMMNWIIGRAQRNNHLSGKN
ncbi:MAG: VTT domain-containing protein [Burkholderiales bacterium]|nr:VTT domain-containing protein [Nitrosomonas sp.]MCP5274724.1 VTT domain-containing protein [Burkholderiales bacterium]